MVRFLLFIHTTKGSRLNLGSDIIALYLSLFCFLSFPFSYLILAKHIQGAIIQYEILFRNFFTLRPHKIWHLNTWSYVQPYHYCLCSVRCHYFYGQSFFRKKHLPEQQQKSTLVLQYIFLFLLFVNHELWLFINPKMLLLHLHHNQLYYLVCPNRRKNIRKIGKRTRSLFEV